MSNIHIVCPACGATNRLARERLDDKPSCGRCSEHLFEGEPVPLDETSMPRHLNNSGIPLVVDFWAPWCGPCRQMAPAFEAAAAMVEPRARLAKLDTEQHPGLAAQYDIRSIPTMIVFRNGREVARQAGALPQKQLVEWIRHKLGP